MLKTLAQIAKLKNVSRASVCEYLKKHEIKPEGKNGKSKTYNCSKEPLASYIKNKRTVGKEKIKKQTKETTEKPENKKRPEKPIKETQKNEIAQATIKTADTVRISKSLNNLLNNKMPAGHRPASYFYKKALEIAEVNQDAALLLKLAQIAAKEDNDEALQLQAIETEKAKERIAIEQAERLKLENDIRRGIHENEYMERAVVKRLFGQVYAVHTSMIMPLGIMLADMINAIPAGKDRSIRIQEMIDSRVYAALESIKNLLVEFIEAESADGAENTEKKRKVKK